ERLDRQSTWEGHESLVVYAHEKQPLRRCGWPSFLAVFACQNLGDFALRPEAAANVHERAGDGSHHIVQEAIGLRRDPYLLAGPTNRHMSYRPHARHAVRPIGFEAVEIVPASKRRGRAGHGGRIEHVTALAAIAAQERAGNRTVVNDIAIELPHG